MVDIQYKVPSWNEIYGMLLSQAQKIFAKGYKPDIIIGIARGGIIPARILSDLLETPQLVFIQIDFYANIQQTKPQPTLTHQLNTTITGKKTLLVDDIADTGKSIKIAKTHIIQQGAKRIKTATLYFKPKSTTMPDFYEKQTNDWVIFPWDTKETLLKIIRKNSDDDQIAKLVKAGLPKQLAEILLKDMH